MVKTELIDKLAEQNPSLSRSKVKDAVDAIFGQFTKCLSEGRRIELRGFGSFELRAKSPRVGRNPKTGESVDVKAKNRVHFKPGKELKEKVDNLQAA